jgi:hypothetical protein
MKLVSELSEMSEIEMVQIENDELMQKYFYQIGMDCYDFPFVYVPNKHRTLAGEVVTGFRCVGELRCDSAFRDSYLAGITERLIISSYLDTSLMLEIAELSYKVRDFDDYLNDCDSIDFDESRALFPANQLEDDWVEQEAIIKNLQDVLTMIRGPVYNASGALKTAEEYKEFAVAREFYEEKYATN